MTVQEFLDVRDVPLPANERGRRIGQVGALDNVVLGRLNRRFGSPLYLTIGLRFPSTRRETRHRSLTRPPFSSGQSVRRRAEAHPVLTLGRLRHGTLYPLRRSAI